MFAAVPLKWEILISMISLGTWELQRKSETLFKGHGAIVEEKKKKGKEKKRDIMVYALKHDLV